MKARHSTSMVAVVLLATPMVHAAEITVSGHIARIAQHVSGVDRTDDESSWEFKDAGVSPSRFRITGTEDLANGMTAGVNLEYAVGSGGGDSPKLRHSNLYLTGEEWGTVTFGHTAPATNGTNDDLSASGLAVDMACSDAAGTGLTDTQIESLGLGAIYGNIGICTDFTAGRRGVIRYNTSGDLPVGFGGSVADNLWDAQVSLSGDLGAGSYALRASYADNDPEDGNDSTTMSVAAAVKFSGVSASTLWGRINPDGDNNNITGYGAKLGYDIGDDMGIGVLYRSVEGEFTDAEPSAWGIGLQNNVTDNVSAFTGYYVADWDIEGLEKIKTFNVGMRVTF